MTYRLTGQADKWLAVEKQLTAYLKHCAKKKRTPSVGVIIQMAVDSNDGCSDNTDTNESEYPLRGFKLTYRINGRATQAEERFLKSTKYLIGDEAITPKKKYKELKALRDEHGWSAFDKDQKMLFDNLEAKFGKASFDNDNAVQKTAFDIKPSTLAARDKAIAAGDSSHNDDRDFDKEGSRKFDLRPKPSRPYPPNQVQPVNDGVNASNKSPAQCAAKLEVWRLEHPESEYPDYREDGTGIIQPEWKPPEYKKTTDRAAVLAEKLKVLFDFRNQNPIEPVQTNIFIGDNDNYIYEEGDPNKVKRDAESEMEMRPSRNEMSALVKGVHFEKRYVTRPDSYDMDYRLIPKRGFTVGPDGKSVLQGGDVEWADNGAIKRMGGLRFNTADKDLADKFSKHRGEKTQYVSGGQWRWEKDAPYEITGGPPAVTVLNALFDKELGAKRSNSDIKKWTHPERNALGHKAKERWEKLELRLYGSLYGEGNVYRHYSERRLQGNELDTLPVLPTASMSVNDALVFCGLEPKPANENRIRFGLPCGTISAAHLSMAASCMKPNAATGKAAKAQSSAAMSPAGPDGILLRREGKERFDRAASELTPDEVKVVESFLSAENLAQVGRETGDEGKHHRTQEINGQRRVLQVAAKFEAIMSRIAA
jgi:hypothetical protein